MARTSDDPATAASAGLQGISGWLVLPAIGTFLAPFFYVYDIVDVVRHFSPSLPAAMQGAFAVAVAIDIVMIAGWGVAIHALVKKRPLYPKLFIVLIVVTLIMSVAATVFIMEFFRQELRLSDIRDTVMAAMAVAIWCPYMLLSKRVRATFGWPRPRG